MSKEKQIEEMILTVKNAVSDNAAIDLDEDIITLDGNDLDHVAEQIAEALYNAGYRKQSEGEWIGEADGLRMANLSTMCDIARGVTIVLTMAQTMPICCQTSAPTAERK